MWETQYLKTSDTTIMYNIVSDECYQVNVNNLYVKDGLARGAKIGSCASQGYTQEGKHIEYPTDGVIVPVTMFSKPSAAAIHSVHLPSLMLM